MTKRVPVGVFFALFTISGFAGLIYQSIWSHYLKLFLGHAAYAQTLVLAIFMGGMALGSWLVSRYTARIRNLLMGYAIAELGIGFLALVFHSVFVAATNWAFDSVLPNLGSPASVDAFKWLLASVLIIPASILLGTTFPLMSAGIIRLYPENSGRALSMLYFTNSLGAAFGVLASGFYLIELLGLPGTILTAGIFNILLALVVWALTKRLPPVTVEPTGPKAAAGSGRPEMAILIFAFATGAASFIYEVTWIRMLTMGLGASSHSFEVMLSAFILGIALGGYAIRNRIAGMSRDATWLTIIVAAKGLLAVVALGVYVNVLDLTLWMMTGTAHTPAGYTLITSFGYVASTLVMFPSAFLAGMSLPVATNLLLARGVGEAAIGKGYSANTAGCIVGAFFTTHVGMVAFGLKGLTGVGAALDIAVAAMVYVAFNPQARIRAAVASAVLAAIGVAVYASVHFDQLKMASGVFRTGYFLNPSAITVPFYRDGKTATISVTAAKTQRAIQTNGKPDASIELENRLKPATDEPTMILAAALPLAYKPDATDVAVIGFGSGLSTHTVLGSPKVKVVDTIEIEPMMVEGAKLFHKRVGRAYDDPRSHIHIDDAKTFFASTNAKYDFIISEPSNPWVSGTSTLFSDEFYRQVRRYLKDDGLLVQWVQIYEINVDLVSTIFKALGKSFSDYRVYSAARGDMIVIAVKQGKLPPMSTQIFGYRELTKDLADQGFHRIEDLDFARIGSRRALEPLFLASAYPANSDYFPVLDLNAARSRFMRESSAELQDLRKSFTPLIEALDGDVRFSAKTIGNPEGVKSPYLEDAQQARDLVNLWLVDDAPAGTLAPEAAQHYRFARLALTDCRLMTPTWVTVVENTFRAAAPILKSEDLKPLVQKIAASKCVAGLDERSRLTLNFFSAVALRDYAEAAKSSEVLLENADPSEYTSLVLGNVAANLALNQPAKARATWDKYQAKIPDADRTRYITRLVKGHVSAIPSAR